MYALVTGKGGAKLKESPPDPEVPAAEAPKGAITIGGNQIRINPGAGGTGTATVTSAQNGTIKMAVGTGGQMRMEMSKVTMPAFAEMITRFVDRPVVDMTELKGNFQVALDLSPDRQQFWPPRSGGQG